MIVSKVVHIPAETIWGNFEEVIVWAESHQLSHRVINNRLVIDVPPEKGYLIKDDDNPKPVQVVYEQVP